MASKKPSLTPKWYVRLFKLFFIMALIVTPLFILVLIFTPIVSQKSHKYLEQYRLREEFTRSDFDVFIERMREDKEYGYYFEVLNQSQEQAAVNEAYQLLDQTREAGRLRELIQQQKEKVDAAAKLVLHLEFVEEFLANPSSMPELELILWDLITEEFKLTLLGLCYQATYKPDFQFYWSEDTISAAYKFRATLLQIEKRKTGKITPQR